MKDMPVVALIDYKMCNLYSVSHACRSVGLNPIVTSDHAEIDAADAVILPGVGAFGDAMKNLLDNGLDRSIEKAVSDKKPFMGICLGFQLLFTESEEFGIHKGLGIFPGTVKRFPEIFENKVLKVPYIGWNKISISKESAFLYGINDEEYMYFVHSFCVNPQDKAIVATETRYNGFSYCSSIETESLFACQFHPEKSSLEGMKIYRNWAKAIK